MTRLSLSSPVRLYATMFARALICVAMLSIPGLALAQDAPSSGDAGQADQPVDEEKLKAFQSIEWVEGAAMVELGPTARLKVSHRIVFTGPEGATTLLELLENPPPKGLLGIMAPFEGLDWYIVFESKPDIKRGSSPAKIDADALLRALQQENEELNVIRRARGWPECSVLKLEAPPAYEGSRDDVTWTTKMGEGDEQVINVTTRLIGREGSIEATLVVEPKDADRMRSTFRNILSLVEFNDEIKDDDSSLGDQTAGQSSWASGYRTSPYPSRLLRRRSLSTRLIGGIVFALITGAISVYKKLRGPSEPQPYDPRFQGDVSF